MSQIDNRLEVTVVSSEKYRQSKRKGEHKSSDPIFKNALGTSAWQALQNVIDKNGNRIFTESDITKIYAQIEKQRIDVSSGTVNLNDCIIAAGLEHKLEAMLKVAYPDSPANQVKTSEVEAAPKSEPVAPQPKAEQAQTEPAKTAKSEPEQVVATHAETKASNPITRLFNIARMADKKPDDIATYDLNKDGKIDLDEQAKAIKKIQKENKSLGATKLAKGDTNTDEEIAMIEDMIDLDNQYGFYYAQGNSKKAKNAKKVKANKLDAIKNQKQDATQYARQLLQGINSSELTRLTQAAEKQGGGDVVLNAQDSTPKSVTTSVSVDATAEQSTKPNVVEGKVVGNRGMISVGGKTYQVKSGFYTSNDTPLTYKYDNDTGKMTFTGQGAIIKAANGQNDNIEINGTHMSLETGDGDDTVIVNGKQTGAFLGDGNDTVTVTGDGFGTPIDVGNEDDKIINNGENFFFVKNGESVNVPKATTETTTETATETATAVPQPAETEIQSVSDAQTPTVAPIEQQKAEDLTAASPTATTASVNESEPLEPSFDDVGEFVVPDAPKTGSSDLGIAVPAAMDMTEDTIPLNVDSVDLQQANVVDADKNAELASTVDTSDDSLEVVEYIPSQKQSFAIKQPKYEEKPASTLVVNTDNLPKPEVEVDLSVVPTAEVDIASIGEISVPELDEGLDDVYTATTGMSLANAMFADPFATVETDANMDDVTEESEGTNKQATDTSSVGTFFRNFKFKVDWDNPGFKKFNFATDGLVQQTEEPAPKLVKKETPQSELVYKKPNLGFEAQEIILNKDNSVVDIEVDGKRYLVMYQDESGKDSRFYYGVNPQGETVFYGNNVRVASTSSDANNVNFQVTGGTFLANGGDDTITVNDKAMGATIELRDGRKVVTNNAEGVSITGVDGNDTVNNSTKTLSINGGKTQAEIEAHQAQIKAQVDVLYSLLVAPAPKDREERRAQIRELQNALRELVKVVDGENFSIGSGRDEQKDALSFSGDESLSAKGINELWQKVAKYVALAKTDESALNKAWLALVKLDEISETGYPTSPNPLSEEEIRRYNAPKVEEEIQSLVAQIGNGRSAEELMSSNAHERLMALAASGMKINFYPSRNLEFDAFFSDGSKLPAGATPDEINGYYVQLAEGFNEGNPTKVNAALANLAEVSSWGIPTQPQALTREQIETFERKEAAYDTVVKMITEGKSTEEIMASPSFKELQRLAKDGVNVRFNVSREDENDVPRGMAISDTHSVAHLKMLYDTLMRAIKADDTEGAKCALNSLAILKNSGYPISPEYATDEELAEYNSSYQNLCTQTFSAKSRDLRGCSAENYYQKGRTNGYNPNNRIEIAGRLALGVDRATDDISRWPWEDARVAEPDARTLRDTIFYHITDKSKLDAVNKVLVDLGKTTIGNSVEYVIKNHVPAEHQKKLYIRLATIDPYFRRVCIERYPETMELFEMSEKDMYIALAKEDADFAKICAAKYPETESMLARK